MPVSLRQLRAFLAVVEAESFTGAAEALHLTQSAVSMLIRQLEADLTIALFVRSGRGAHPTEFATSIRPTVQRVLEDVQNISDAAADLRALQRGHLRIALPQMLGCCWLPGVLGAFRRRFPEIAISVSETAGDGVIDLVARGEAEIGIGPERAPASGVDGTWLWDVPMRLVVSREGPLGAAGTSPSEAELRAARWISYSDDFSGLLHRILLGRSDVPQGWELRVSGLMSALALISRDAYVTVAPAYAEVFAEMYGLRFLPLDSPARQRRFLMYSRAKHELSPSAAAFLELARAQGPHGATRH